MLDFIKSFVGKEETARETHVEREELVNFGTDQGDRTFDFKLLLVNLQNLRVDSRNDQNHMLRRLLPHVRKHILKRFHVLRGVPDKWIFTKTRNINLSVPLVVSIEQSLMNFIRLLNLVLGFLSDSANATDTVADPFHVTETFGFGVDDRFHLLFGSQDAQYTLQSALLLIQELLFADFKNALDLLRCEALAAPVLQQVVGFELA